MPDADVLTIDAMVARAVRAAVADVLRAEIAPLRDRIDALVAATPPALVDVAAAAARLGLSPSRVRGMCASGELPAVRLGRSWRVDLAALPRPTKPETVAMLAREARSR